MLQIAGKQCAQEQVGAWFQFISETSLLFARTWQEGIQSADLQINFSGRVACCKGNMERVCKPSHGGQGSVTVCAERIELSSDFTSLG